MVAESLPGFGIGITIISFQDHVGSVFFDLESVYDTTWKYGIMKESRKALKKYHAVGCDYIHHQILKHSNTKSR